ncbi:long-chain fatty acid--CoA ligase [Nocardia sp. NPDC052278]|uniref:long-chain-fatty-acid--CoA ligase n=1 Tax=unclassified Nocardia TaxID=2637762 RepID=UPI0036AA6AE1
MNLAGNLVISAHNHPHHVAIRLDETAVSYGHLEALSQHIGGLLAAYEVAPGDRVAIMLPNVPHFAALYYAILRMGAVVVPMNPLLKEREVAYYLRDSGAKLIFVWQDFAAEAAAGATQAGSTAIPVVPAEFLDQVMAIEPREEVIERRPDDTAVILYTSGTTGLPKGAELTHANLGSNVDVCTQTLLELTADDVIFGGLPLFHVFGQTCALNAAVRVGATLTLLPRFDPAKALELLVRDQVTVFEGVPTMYSALLNHPGAADIDLGALRLCVSGGSALPVEVLHAFEKQFGCVVLEGYGLSETSPVACFNHPDRPRVPGSIGTPVRGVELRVVDDEGGEVADGTVGEIVIRGDNIMKGYWNKHEETAEAITDGWFHTGDLGRIDANGNYFIVDRKKDMIIRGGYNVYPREVEEALYEHPDVAEAAVVGVAHAELGEEVAAAVALKPGASVGADELREFVKERVAAYKYPRHLHIVDALPKGPTGKILKREINLHVDHSGSTIH